ncbi:MAG: hypothetical protein LUI05_07505 [Oscillospiraceae bacterium]|nr:hypothetical protein [Oscillospiraceae bacterium]
MSKKIIPKNKNSDKVSYKVSLGGIVSAICLVMMFLTAVIPPLNITLPLFSGMMILVVAIEISHSWAFVTYLVVSILSFFITPDKEAAIFFAVLFGYYPILKDVIEKISFKTVQWILKIALFNVAIVVIYQLTVKLLGTVDLIEEFGFMKQFMIPGLLIMFNGVLILYDVTLTMVKDAYVRWFRPTFLRKFK